MPVVHRQLCYPLRVTTGFPGREVVKNPPVNAGDARDMGLSRGSGRSLGGGNGVAALVFSSGKTHGQGGLAGYPWGHKESDMTKN